MTNQLYRALKIWLSGLLISSTAAAAQSVNDRIRAIHEAAAVAAQLCTTPPMEDQHHALTLGLGAKASLAKLVSWLAGVGISGAAKYETGSSQGVLQRDLAQSIRDSNKCKQDVVNKLTDKLIAQSNDVPPPPPVSPSSPAARPSPVPRRAAPRHAAPPIAVPTSFDKPNGQFRRFGRFWIETPEYAPSQNFTFTELGHDRDYVYLVDRSRPAPGTADDPMIVRLPIRGGWAQWTYKSPADWKNFILVNPS